MKDLGGLTHSFVEWSTVLNFLTGIKETEDNIRIIHITKECGKGWTMIIKGTDKAIRDKPKTPGAALYDLYW